MERDQATRMMQTLLKKLVEKNGSDLFITVGFPPAIKVDGEVHRVSDQDLSPAQSPGAPGLCVRGINIPDATK